MPRLIIIRGLPGAGKSTLAKSLNVLHVEADMFHMRDGDYQWKAENVSKAHQWCKAQVEEAMLFGFDVAVSNTFTRIGEFEDYIELGQKYKYDIKIIACKNHFGNVHHVPLETLIKMRNRWQDYESEEIYEVGNDS